MPRTQTVFSEYEVRKLGIRIGEDTTHTIVECVGSAEEEMEALVVQKKCRGVVRKRAARGTGAGTLTISVHIPYSVYIGAYGMEGIPGLKEGVNAYGENSRHPNMSITELVQDEDGVEKYKAYPNCIMTNGRSGSVENGAEEVAEVELEITVMPDEYGNGLYEALVADLDAEAAANWLENFTPALVQDII